jgi:hypothetical protein
MILSRRVNDDDHRDRFTKWPFMTTHTWGEYPQGTWSLEVSTDKSTVPPVTTEPVSVAVTTVSSTKIEIYFRLEGPKFGFRTVCWFFFSSLQNSVWGSEKCLRVFSTIGSELTSVADIHTKIATQIWLIDYCVHGYKTYVETLDKHEYIIHNRYIVLLTSGADNSLAQPTSRCILFDGENISFDASIVIYINSTNIPPIMIKNRIYEHQNLLSL